MTGLQKELAKNYTGKKMRRNSQMSITGISELLDASYPSAKRKILQNYFTVDEALSILNTLFIDKSNDMNYFKYLFTEQGE